MIGEMDPLELLHSGRFQTQADQYHDWLMTDRSELVRTITILLVRTWRAIVFNILLNFMIDPKTCKISQLKVSKGN